MKQILWWFGILGIPLAALSLISLVQRWLGIGLAEGLSAFLGFYRAYARVVVGFFPDLVSINVPASVYDLWALSLLLGSIQMRATLQTEAAKGAALVSLGYVAGGVLWLIFLTYSFLGLIFGIYSIVSAISVLTIPKGLERISTPSHDMPRYTAWLLGSLFASLAAVAVFYALNAYAPQLDQIPSQR